MKCIFVCWLSLRSCLQTPYFISGWLSLLPCVRHSSLEASREDLQVGQKPEGRGRCFISSWCCTFQMTALHYQPNRMRSFVPSLEGFQNSNFGEWIVFHWTVEYIISVSYFNKHIVIVHTWGLWNDIFGTHTLCNGLVMVRVRYFEVSPALLPTAYPPGYTWKSFLLTSHALFLQGFCGRYLSY